MQPVAATKCIVSLRVKRQKQMKYPDERDISSILPKHVKNMLQQFELTCDDISCLLTEDVTNCQTFMVGMNNLATKCFEFDLMYSKYKSQTSNPRNTSKLRQKIESILREIKDFCAQLKELSGIILKPSLLLHLLSQNANMKTSLLTNCVINCVKLFSLLSDKDLRRDIRRRISQQWDQSKKGDEIQNMKMECCNDKSLSWVQSFTSVINRENCGMPCKPLPPSQLIKIGKLLEDSTTVLLEILIENSDVDIHNGGKSGFIKQILLHLPVMLIDIDSPIIINIR